MFRSPLSVTSSIVWKAALVILPALSGCSHLGPTTVAVDRFDYNKVTGESSNQQLLLNIIRLRYGEPVHWIEVSSMISRYQFQATAAWQQWYNSLDVFRNPFLRGAIGGVDAMPNRQNQWNAGAQYQDSPTITYTPLEGQQFSQRFLSPIPIAVVAYFIQAGWPADQVLDCCVQRMNEFENLSSGDSTQPSDGDENSFHHLAALLRKGQLEHRLSLRFQVDHDHRNLYLIPNQSLSTDPDRIEFFRLLKLSPSAERVRLTESMVSSDPDVLSMETRSLLGVFQALAAGVEVPVRDQDRGKALANESEVVDCGGSSSWLRIKSSCVPRTDAFVQVNYHGSWFFICENDIDSKRSFSLLTYLYALQSTDVATKGPLITIPASGS